jgi:hypothetical protein
MAKQQTYKQPNKPKQRLALPPETVERKREMSSVALVVEFEDGNVRKFWTNEFTAKFPKWKRGQVFTLCEEFKSWEFFKSPKYYGKIRTAAIFDTRADKTLNQEYKLMSYQRGQWFNENYANLILP